MKQTAVDWLVEKLKENGVDFWQEEIEIIEEAKEMEKEQMKEIAWHFRDIDMSKKNKGLVIDLEFEQYYIQTFKSE